MARGSKDFSSRKTHSDRAILQIGRFLFFVPLFWETHENKVPMCEVRLTCYDGRGATVKS